jgi:hypothetical protein
LPACLKKQDAIVAQVLDELEDEAVWTKQFAARGAVVRQLADEALSELRQGETRPLDDLL